MMNDRLKNRWRWLGRAALFLSLSSFLFPAWAHGSITIAINGMAYKGTTPMGNTALSVGTPITLEVIVKGTRVSHPVQLPSVNGLVLNGSGINPQPRSESFSFFLTPIHPGIFTIKPFDIHADDGQVLHVNPISFAVSK